MDWNHNGKQDPADDIIDMKLSESDTEPAGSSSGRPHVSRIHFGVWLPVIYLGLLLPGDIPINGFTMTIGLICAGLLSAGVVVAVAFHEVDNTPHRKTRTEGDNKRLENRNCLIDKCHT